jgi:hypothetical protein
MALVQNQQNVAIKKRILFKNIVTDQKVFSIYK